MHRPQHRIFHALHNHVYPAAVSEPRQLSNREKNTFFFETQGIVVKGPRNCDYERIEELRCAEACSHVPNSKNGFVFYSCGLFSLLLSEYSRAKYIISISHMNHSIWRLLKPCSYAQTVFFLLFLSFLLS